MNSLFTVGILPTLTVHNKSMIRLKQVEITAKSLEKSQKQVYNIHYIFSLLDSHLPAIKFEILKIQDMSRNYLYFVLKNNSRMKNKW